MTMLLAEVEQKQAAMLQLNSLITALRGIATARAEQCRGKIPAIQNYSRTIAQSIGQALDLQAPVLSPPPAARHATILFGSEQGFVGNLNEQLWSAVAALDPDTVGDLLVLGRRMAELGAERGASVTATFPMAIHADSLPGIATGIADWLYQRVDLHRVTHARIIFAQAQTASAITLSQRQLLPFDYTRFPRLQRRQPVHHYLPPAELIELITGEYVFAEICEAGMQALAAENEARLASMAAAKRNIEQMSAELTGTQHQLRQAAITSELLELAAAGDFRF